MKKILSFALAIVALITLASCIKLSNVDYLQIDGDLPEYVLVNEELDLAEIKISAKMTDGTVVDLDLSKVTVTGNTPTQMGKNVCTVSYDNASATITYYAYQQASSLVELETAEDGAYLFYPTGEYKTTKMITINSDVVVLGEKGTKFSMATENETFDGVVTDSNGNNTFHMFILNSVITFNNISFLGLNGTGKYEGNYLVETAMELRSGELSVLNCNITDFGKSSLVARDNTKVLFDNNYLNYTTPQTSNRAPNAIQIDNNCVATITNNTINGFYNPTAPLWASGIAIYGDSEFIVSSNTFINCGAAIYIIKPATIGNITVSKIGSEYKVSNGTVEESILFLKDYILPTSKNSALKLDLLTSANVLDNNTFINSTISDIAIYMM